jgi:uncharacterized protein DUF2752
VASNDLHAAWRARARHARQPRLRSALACAGALGAAFVLMAVDPSSCRCFGTCPFLWSTGLLCAGCGALRAAHALLNGQIAQAVAYNPMVTVTAPMIVAWFGNELLHITRGRRLSAPRATYVIGRALVVVLVAFTIARNLPVPWAAIARPHSIAAA